MTHNKIDKTSNLADSIADTMNTGPQQKTSATIQVTQRGSTGVEKSIAGYLREWRWVAENLNDNCRSFSLIIVAIRFQATSHHSESPVVNGSFQT